MHFTHQQRHAYPVQLLCETIDLKRPTYYRWAKSVAVDTAVAAKTSDTLRAATLRRQEVTRLTIQQFHRHQGRYGSRRMVAELAGLDYRVSRAQVRAIYRKYGLRAIQPRSFVPKTTQPHPNRRRSPNLLLNQPPPKLPDRLWVGDITYLPLLDGSFCYLATLQDGFSRTIVGYAVADHMREELTLAALDEAIRWRCPAAGLIVHTDGGGQYSSIAFRRRLAEHSYLSSMTRRDNHYDNAQAESFFSRFKAKLLVEGRRFTNLAEAQTECFEFIQGYYNTVRRHSSIGYLSPLNLEKQLRW